MSPLNCARNRELISEGQNPSCPNSCRLCLESGYKTPEPSTKASWTLKLGTILLGVLVYGLLALCPSLSLGADIATAYKNFPKGEGLISAQGVTNRVEEVRVSSSNFTISAVGALSNSTAIALSQATNSNVSLSARIETNATHIATVSNRVFVLEGSVPTWDAAWQNPEAYTVSIISDEVYIQNYDFENYGSTIFIPDFLSGRPVRYVSSFLQAGTKPVTDFYGGRYLWTASLSGCTNLVYLTLEGQAFFSTAAGCTKLSQATLNNMTIIPMQMFNGCSSLTTVAIPKAVNLWDSSFRNCTSLKTLTMPAVTSVGTSTFYGCTSLTQLVFSASTAPAESTLVFAGVPANQVSIVVDNPAATGWGTTWNGMPVVRPGLIAESAVFRNASVTNSLSLRNAVFSETTPANPVAGQLWYENGSLHFKPDNGDTILQFGEEMIGRYRNQTGATITNGSAVYMSGETGDNPTIALANVNSVSQARAMIGLATEDIPHGSDGRVCSFGMVRDIPRTFFDAASGSDVFLNHVAGSLSTVISDAYVGKVARVHGQQLDIFVVPVYDLTTFSYTVITNAPWITPVTSNLTVYGSLVVSNTVIRVTDDTGAVRITLTKDWLYMGGSTNTAGTWRFGVDPASTNMFFMYFDGSTWKTNSFIDHVDGL